MSNQVFINVNKVENVKTKKTYCEIAISDGYGSGSVDVEEEQIPKTDLEALQYLKDYGSDERSDVCDVVDTILEYSLGVTINDTFYEWDKIKHIFDME